MEKNELKNKLTNLFPEFDTYWIEEDIFKEEDETYTVHGLMSSFFFFYKEGHSTFNNVTIENVALMFKEVVASDPNDESTAANAICTSFLELLDEEREGKVLESYLGEECKKFLRIMRGYS